MSKFCTLSSYIISERTTGSYNGLGDFLVEPKRLTLSPGKNPDKGEPSGIRIPPKTDANANKPRFPVLQ